MSSHDDLTIKIPNPIATKRGRKAILFAGIGVLGWLLLGAVFAFSGLFSWFAITTGIVLYVSFTYAINFSRYGCLLQAAVIPRVWQFLMSLLGNKNAKGHFNEEDLERIKSDAFERDFDDILSFFLPAVVAGLLVGLCVAFLLGAPLFVGLLIGPALMMWCLWLVVFAILGVYQALKAFFEAGVILFKWVGSKIDRLAERDWL